MSIFSSLRYCLGEQSDHKYIWGALAFMPFGLFFDFMDGKVARWRGKASLLGQELDSLADLVWIIHPNAVSPCRLNRVDIIWRRPSRCCIFAWNSHRC